MFVNACTCIDHPMVTQYPRSDYRKEQRWSSKQDKNHEFLYLHPSYKHSSSSLHSRIETRVLDIGAFIPPTCPGLPILLRDKELS
jgi:hypothetical protein